MQKRELSIQKVVLGIILSIIILGVAQTVALMFAESSASLGLPSILVIALSAILYVDLTILGLSLMGHKLLSYSLVDIRLQPVKLSILDVLVSLFLPLCVFLGLFLSGGHFEMGEVSPSHQGIIIAQTVLFYGLAVGIVEEMIFRAIIFTLLENHYNRALAVWLPSSIFGFLHIIGGADDFLSMIQVLIAGTLVGVLFRSLRLRQEVSGAALWRMVFGIVFSLEISSMWENSLSQLR